MRRYFFENPPEIFYFFTLPLEIPGKTMLKTSKKCSNPQNCVILDPLEIPKPKTKTPENFTLFFLGRLITLLEIPLRF